MENKVTINELLCWVVNMIKVLDCTQIVQLATKKFKEDEIKHGRDIISKLVIKDKDKPEFAKRLSHNQGDSKSEKLMKEIYQICQEYAKEIAELTIVARDFSKLPAIAFSGFSDISGILLGLQSLKIQAGISKECNQTALGLIQGIVNTQKDIVERLSLVEQGIHVDKGNATPNGDEIKSFSCSECGLKFDDMGECISHKEIHTKTKISDTSKINEENKKEKVSELADNGENSDKSKKGKEPQTAKMEESKGKSSDGMNDQVFNRNNGSDTIYTYEEKDRNMNEKIVAAKTLVPQSFLPQCDRKIPYAVGLGSHVDSHKDYNPLSLPTTDIIKPPSVNSIGPMPFPCTEWDFNFNLKASQNKHSGVHTGNKPYSGGNGGAIPKNFRSASNIYNCDKCSEIFLDKPSLKTHRCKGNNDGLETFLASKGKQTNMHEQETPFSCKDCDFKCIGMEGMKIHMEIHKEKTFSCKDCDFKCIGMEGMKIHMETHKDKPFKCNECEFKCQKWNDMKVHMNTHKEESNFVCDIEGCNYICGEVSTLNTHKRIHEKKFSDVAKSPPRLSQTSDTNKNTSTFRQGQKKPQGLQ